MQAFDAAYAIVATPLIIVVQNSRLMQRIRLLFFYRHYFKWREASAFLSHHPFGMKRRTLMVSLLTP